MKTSTRVLSLAGAFSLVVVALTGCTAPQTKEEACTYLNEEVTTYSETVQKDMTDAMKDGDEAKYVELVKGMVVKYESIGNGVNNAEVKASYSKLVSIMKEMVPFLEKMVADPSSGMSDDFNDVSERGSKASDEFAKVCPNVDMN